MQQSRRTSLRDHAPVPHHLVPHHLVRCLPRCGERARTTGGPLDFVNHSFSGTAQARDATGRGMGQCLAFRSRKHRTLSD